MLLFAKIGFCGDAFNRDETFENFANFAVMKNLQFTGVSDTETQFAGRFDDFYKGLKRFVFVAGVLQIFYGHGISKVNHAAADGIAAEIIREMFELIIDELAGLHDGVVKGRNRGSRHDDGHDAFDILLGVVA